VYFHNLLSDGNYLIKKARITLVAFDSLGDSLIYLMIAENLRINDYEVTFYSGLIHQMQEWVPQLKVRLS